MAQSGYDFYLGRCLLPIAPPKLTVKINNANETATLINEGEINILRQAGLTDIEFECRIPQEVSLRRLQVRIQGGRLLPGLL